MRRLKKEEIRKEKRRESKGVKERRAVECKRERQRRKFKEMEARGGEEEREDGKRRD